MSRLPCFCCRVVLLPALALLMAACAQTTQLHNAYQAAGATPINSLLIAIKTPEPHNRQIWEAQCRSALSSPTLKTTVASKWLGRLHNASLETLIKTAKQHHINGVLQLNITSLLLTANQPRNNNSPVISIDHYDASQKTSGNWQVELGDTTKNNQNSQLQQAELQLFDLQGKLLWEATLTSHEANNRRAIAKSQCAAVARHLPTHLNH